VRKFTAEAADDPSGLGSQQAPCDSAAGKLREPMRLEVVCTLAVFLCVERRPEGLTVIVRRVDPELSEHHWHSLEGRYSS
jgi:hypothetical protein